MKGRHLRRRFSLQPSFMKDDNDSEDRKREKYKIFIFPLVSYYFKNLSYFRIKGSDSASTDGSISPSSKIRHKIVVMGSTKVGKTSIITQFLYNSFTTKYKKTIEEMHQGSFPIAGVNLTLDILDTAGCNEVILNLNLKKANIKKFVISVSSYESSLNIVC